ncbi:MAG: hypothetical protein ABW046_06325 [Actinoplanes sp.]
MRRRVALSAVALAAAPIVAGLLAAPVARAAEIPSRSRIGTALLNRDGAQVRVGLSVTCPAGARIHLNVAVTGDAHGARAVDAHCTGRPQEVVLRIGADPGGALFLKGPATARTIRTVCADGACTITPFDETIKIR